MRISDWSSDVCSSDLRHAALRHTIKHCIPPAVKSAQICGVAHIRRVAGFQRRRMEGKVQDTEARKSVGSGKSVSVRVDLGGRRIIKKNTADNKEPLTASMSM